MNNWENVRFENAPIEIIDGDRGVNYPKQSDFMIRGHCLFLNAGNVTALGFDFSNCSFINEVKDKVLRKGKLSRNDIVLTTRGTVGNLAFYDERIPFENLRINSGMVIFRADQSKIFPRYLYFLLRSNIFSEQVSAFSTGSAQPQLPIRDIKQIELPLPPLREQCLIAGILGALDDKIELNRRMNATLEAMARTVFQRWFVENEAVGNWKVGKMGDIAENIRRGANPEDIETDTPYIGLEHMPRGSIALSDWSNANEVVSNKFFFKQGEFLFGKLRPYFHKVGIAPLDGVCSTDILVIVPKSSEWYGFVLGHISSVELINYTNAASTGTKMPRTNWSDIARYEVAIPPIKIAKDYNVIFLLMAQQIRANIMQSRTLASLRDALLPRLISGEIRIANERRGSEGD